MRDFYKEHILARIGYHKSTNTCTHSYLHKLTQILYVDLVISSNSKHNSLKKASSCSLAEAELAGFFHEGNIPGFLPGLFPMGRNTFLPTIMEEMGETKILTNIYQYFRAV